jgi:tetratricopeptide (TPR) repeat protein
MTLSHAMALGQAQSHLDAGRIDQAIAVCRQVVRADKRNAGAWRLLGCAAKIRGDLDDAVASLRRCLTLRPDDVDALGLMAETLTTMGLHREALERYDRALKLRPGYAPAVAGKAEVLLRQGRPERALTLLGPWIESGRRDPALAVVHSRALRRLGRAEEAADAARAGLEVSGAGGEVTRALHFALGQALEDAGDYGAAIAAYGDGNRRSHAAYDPAADAAAVDALIDVFDRRLLDAAPRPGASSELPVFIVGMLRCGSTLLEQILDAHPQVHGAGELDDLPALAAAMPLTIGSTLPYPACVRDLDQADVDRLCGAHLERLGRMGRGAARVVDKHLGNYRLLGLIQVLFPRGRVIHMRRDPMDTCASIYAQKLPPGTNGYASDLTALGLAYRQYQRLMDHWRRTLSVPMLELDYEALVEDQEGVSRKALEFIGLPWDERCLRYHESRRTVVTLSGPQVVQPIYRTAIGRAARFGAHLDPLRRALAGDA